MHTIHQPLMGITEALMHSVHLLLGAFTRSRDIIAEALQLYFKGIESVIYGFELRGNGSEGRDLGVDIVDTCGGSGERREKAVQAGG